MQKTTNNKYVDCLPFTYDRLLCKHITITRKLLSLRHMTRLAISFPQKDKCRKGNHAHARVCVCVCVCNLVASRYNSAVVSHPSHAKTSPKSRFQNFLPISCYGGKRGYFITSGKFYRKWKTRNMVAMLHYGFQLHSIFR